MPAVPLKLKKRPERCRAGVLDHEVTVEQQGLQLGQARVVAVEVAPSAPAPCRPWGSEKK